MAPQKSLFWQFGQKLNFVDRYFFWYGFSMIWAIFLLKQLILFNLFFQIQKNLFFTILITQRKKKENQWILSRFRIFFHFCDQNNIPYKIWGPKKNLRMWPCTADSYKKLENFPKSLQDLYLSVLLFCLKLQKSPKIYQIIKCRKIVDNSGQKWTISGIPDQNWSNLA